MGKRKKQKSCLRPLRQALESAGLLGFLAVAGRLPTRWHGLIARLLGRLGMVCIPLRRHILEENLRIAFGELDHAKRDEIIGGVYTQTILFALELARLRHASPQEVSRAVQRFEGREYLDELIASKQGFVIACAHQGNWEWLGAWMAQTYQNFGVVYKPMSRLKTEVIRVASKRRF